MGLFSTPKYGGLGGKAAATEMKTRREVTKSTQDMFETAFDRKNTQEEWALKSEAMKDTLYENKRKLAIQDAKLRGEQNAAPEELNQLRDQVDALTQSNLRTNVSNFFGNLLGSNDSMESVKTANKYLASDPGMASKLGLSPGQVLETPTYKSPVDVEAMKTYLGNTFKQFQALPPEFQEAQAITMLRTGQFVKTNGKMIDVYGMATSMGLLESLPTDTQHTANTRRMGASKAEGELKSVKMGTQIEEISPVSEPVSPRPGTTAVNPTATTMSMQDINESNITSHVAKAEGTTDEMAQAKGFDSGYDVPIAYGKFGMPDKPLSTMTLGEVYTYQQKIKKHPENKFSGGLPSSAVGKGQFVEGTLKGLAADLGYDESTVFSPEVQDEMIQKLYSQHGTKPWEGFEKNPAYAGGQVPQTQTAAYSSQPESEQYQSQGRDRTYQPMSEQEKMSDQIAYGKTDQTALMKEMDFVGKQMGPNATVGDVLGMYSTAKDAGKTESLSSPEKDMRANTRIVLDKVSKDPNYTIDMAEKDIAEYNNKRMTATTMGVGGNVTAGEADRMLENVDLYKGTTAPDVNTLKTMRRNETYLKDLTPAERSEIDGRIEVTSIANDIIEDIDRIGPENILRGGIKGFEQKIGSYGAPGEAMVDTWNRYMGDSSIPDADKEKMVMDTVGVDSKLGMLTAAYLKATSGTAVSDPEYIRLIGDVLQGLQGQDPARTQAALKTFAGVNAEGAYTRLTGLGERGYGATASDAVVDLETAFTKHGYTMPDMNKAFDIAGAYGEGTTKTQAQPTSVSVADQLDDVWAPADMKQFSTMPDGTGLTNDADGSKWVIFNGKPQKRSRK